MQAQQAGAGSEDSSAEESKIILPN